MHVLVIKTRYWEQPNRVQSSLPVELAWCAQSLTPEKPCSFRLRRSLCAAEEAQKVMQSMYTKLSHQLSPFLRQIGTQTDRLP